MHQSEFLARYQSIYEHQDWLALELWNEYQKTPFDLGEIGGKMRAKIDACDDQQKLALLRAHPELVGKLALAQQLTRESTHEQAGAGLDQCSPDEIAQFQRLNQAYNEKFSFPFIVAVSGKTRGAILEIFHQRLHHDIPTEFQTALEQVHQIAQIRLNKLT